VIEEARWPCDGSLDRRGRQPTPDEARRIGGHRHGPGAPQPSGPASAAAFINIVTPAITLAPTPTDYANDYVEATGVDGMSVKVRPTPERAGAHGALVGISADRLR
jgi:hypothetical protein